ncbi:hypothetical protein PENTCL1PPCAC_16743 [Pristionchus entomophagus]|uniref:Shavenoid isoform B-like N-terminal domain-containing protein n=1 Tax=Pristionchus entomophagus TaxID=358040 RepID=A0AAV5TJY6_9BILA|nr:hypothetical protein PENTCL1PPCAC_16743 [Pristionchus entomophagus]
MSSLHSVLLLSSLLLVLPLISSLPSFPLSPLRGVQRRKLLPDLIKPTFCPTPCEKVFGAESRETSEELPGFDPAGSCLCKCPHDRPIYLNALGFCIEKPPEECKSAVVFDDYPLDEVPVLTIEGPQGERSLNTTLSWSAEFSLSADFTPSCHISDVLIDSAVHRWDSSVDSSTFHLNKTEEGAPKVVFNGSDEEASSLVGAVVQLKIACRSLEERSRELDEILLRPALLCITFRVEGESVSAPLEWFHGDSRVQVIVLATVAIVLLLALVASAIAYFLCWRIQKRRLIGSIQLQYRTHLKNANLQTGVMSPLPHHQSGHQRQSSISSSSSNGSPNGGVVQKRRVYFSAEFFEPECLINPPPMAEQFLHDIRRMIDMARERIAARRYIARMHPIFEVEGEEEMVQAMDKRRAALDVVVPPPDHPHSPPSSAEESPRSAKSTDSGRETLDSSSSSDDSASRSEEEEEKETESKETKELNRPKKRSSSIPVAPSRSFRMPETSAAPAATPPPIPPKPAPSMIPRLGQASPKLPQRSLSTPTRLSDADKEAAAAPASFLPGPSQRRHDRRKGYAVFPVDPMLNKSLPRRPRRTATNE